MPATKFTILFQQLSASSTPNAPVHRIGGWSESWYLPSTNLSDAITLASKQAAPNEFGDGLLRSRAALLGKGASIVGFRVQLVDPAGQSQQGVLNLPGNPDNAVDQPQAAALFRIAGVGVGNIKRFIMRGIPDAFIVEGEAAFTGNYFGVVSAFLFSLAPWSFRGRNLAAPANAIQKIDATGKVTTKDPHLFSQFDQVRVLRTLGDRGQAFGGLFQVTALGPSSRELTLGDWTLGVTKGGRIRKEGIIYPAVDPKASGFSRIVTRRVGRPFTSYRGRQARRSD